MKLYVFLKPMNQLTEITSFENSSREWFKVMLHGTIRNDKI